VDHAVAEAVGAGRVDLPPFGEIGHDDARRVRDGYAAAACVVVCETPFGRPNLPNLEAAVASARPLVLVGEMGEDRDFTGGRARGLWDAALAAGAVRVATETDALAAVERLTGTEAS
jgi:hypothetical protein